MNPVVDHCQLGYDWPLDTAAAAQSLRNGTQFATHDGDKEQDQSERQKRMAGRADATVAAAQKSVKE